MKLDIRILVPGLPFDPADPFSRSLGGSETAGLQLAAELAKQGHRITLFANVQRTAEWNRVQIVPADLFSQICGQIPSDLVIVQRNPQAFGLRLPAKVSMLWAHDLLLTRRAPELVGAVHAIDRVITVSDYQRLQWQEACSDLPADLFLVARNAIDMEAIKASRARVPAEARKEKLIVYASRPERGLDNLLVKVFPRVLQQEPEATLAIAAYDCPNPALEGFYGQLQQFAAQYGDRVRWLGALSKDQLYDLMHQARCYVYPTPSPGDPLFNDTSCIAAMESMACGLPFITSNRGALPETLGDAGVLIDLGAEHAGTDEAAVAFAAETVRMLRDDVLHKELVDLGKERAQDLTWAGVASQVVAEAMSIMAEESADGLRLARHFVRRQDIEAALVACKTVPTEHPDQLEQLRLKLEADYAHAQDPQTLAAWYREHVGPGNAHVTDSLMQSPQDRFEGQPHIRFLTIDRAIRTHFKLVDADRASGLRILDMGCAQGECPIVLHNRLGANVVGLDASTPELDRARQLAAKFAKRPQELTFLQTDERVQSFQLSEIVHNDGLFDVAIMAEVLEHVCDPKALIERIEALVKPGGLIVITVPFGPWETQAPERQKRQHLREIDATDLQEMLADKRKLVVDRSAAQFCPVTSEVLGNTYVVYAADQEPLHPIDWRRKLSMQRPRQTLSAQMIVGGATAHETLHWCLNSIKDVVDEIVVGDTGASDEARRILAQYGATVFPAPSPLEEGFETSRNAVLDRCVGDWVMMIDSDERLIGADALNRYLRSNIFHTYSLRQHHLAIDARWHPDLPGRLFRRGPSPEGQVMRYFGLLHEHAEFGINQGGGRTLVLSDVHLAHIGYVHQGNRSSRFSRNLPLLQRDLEKYPDRKLTRLVFMRDSVILAKDMLAKARIDFNEPGAALKIPEAAERCRAAIKMWEDTFADDQTKMAAESMEFYHDAAKLLGCDVVADVRLSAQRQGVGQPLGPDAKFFANPDHLRRFAAAQAKAVTQPLDNRWF